MWPVSNFKLYFNLGFVDVVVRCGSLSDEEGSSRRSWPSLGRNQGRGGSGRHDGVSSRRWRPCGRIAGARRHRRDATHKSWYSGINIGVEGQRDSRVDVHAGCRRRRANCCCGIRGSWRRGSSSTGRRTSPWRTPNVKPTRRPTACKLGATRSWASSGTRSTSA